MSEWRSDPGQCGVLVVDIQEKLLPAIHQQEALLRRARLLCEASRLLSVPVYITEQVPEKLGPTISGLLNSESSDSVLTKHTFSSAPVIKQVNIIPHWVVCGIEAHICVRQTVLDLIEQGSQVTVVADAISSRHATDCQAVLEEFRARGIRVVTVESLIFEWLESSEHPQFKEISHLVRQL